jgi:lactate dehydrogenase-like 2-hydroxyacid dehydrogenase
MDEGVYMRVLLSVPHHFDAPAEYPDFEFVTADPEAWIPDPQKKITKHHLFEMPNLKVISTPSTGTTHIPLDLCSKYGIDVLSLTDDREGLTEIKASSEFAFMLILAVLKKFHVGLVAVRAGKWHENEDMLRGNELYGKNIGIVGMGRIGTNVAAWARMFDCEIICYDPPLGSWVHSIEDVFVKSDVVLVSCTLNDDTFALIGESLLLSMKENACLVNISRGAVLDEEGVVRALKQRPDLRLAVDVVVKQGPHPFLAFPGQVLVTPHVAGCTYESQEKAARIALELLNGRRE